jgi:hypothetical protein
MTFAVTLPGKISRRDASAQCRPVSRTRDIERAKN